MAPPARCLDLTRSVARAGRAATGVDRVERAYLARLLAEPEPLWGLVRTRLGFLLLDSDSLRQAGPALAGLDSAPDLLSLLSWRDGPGRARAEAGLRRLAVARTTRHLLGRMLARHLPPETAFLSVGLANLTNATMAGCRRVPGARIAAMVHDTIPLDRPDLARDGAPARLGALLQAAARADLILCPSWETARGVARHLAVPPPVLVAGLGVTAAAPDPAALPRGLDLATPYFVALGTIEARKDIGLLLDLWERIGTRARLYLCGARGWRAEAVTARLDRGVPGVTELGGLSDGAVAALLGGARALLFPSLAEGFGLPPWEALAQGTLPVCADLAVLRETLGDRAIYLPARERYSWLQEAERLASSPKVAAPPGAVPGWAAHFERLKRAGW